MANDSIDKIVLDCLSNLNLERGDGEKIKFEAATPLLQEGGAIDSMELVSVVVDIEAEIENLLGLSISLTEDESMELISDPFATVKNLIEYVSLVTNGAKGHD
jgi:acyl carrier protein